LKPSEAWRLGQRGEEQLLILVIVKDGFPRVTAAHQVANRARAIKPELSRHAPPPARTDPSRPLNPPSPVMKTYARPVATVRVLIVAGALQERGARAADPPGDTVPLASHYTERRSN
jgi:hypothetical protein